MKYPVLLQAVSSLQAQSKHLMVYEKIKLSERAKSYDTSKDGSDEEQ